MGFKVSFKGFDELNRLLAELKNPIDRQTAKKAGRAAVKEMKDLITGGVSPIQNKGRFPGYKRSYQNRIERASSGVFKRKQVRPVNLTLTGKFLKSLKSKPDKVKSGFGIEIFFDSRFRPSSDLKEKGHREGANGQRKRPIIPAGKEVLADNVIKPVVEIFNKRIAKVIKS